MPEVTQSVAKVEDKVPDGSEPNPGAADSTEGGVTSTSPEKKSPEKNEAEVLLSQGKRHLFVKDYPNAVAVLGDACAKLDEIYGYLADECADAYFSYGRALLELAREESNVLGTEPEKEANEEGDEEEGEEDGDEEENAEENGEAEAKKEKSDGESKEDNETEGESKGNENEESAADETIDTTKEVNEEGEDNVDNLQLAWEVLELAKKIFERQNLKPKLAETFLYLGEVQLESENYSGAIEDMKRCIEVQKEILPPDHREIAETYFQMGVACSLNNEFDPAISNFKTSSEILEARIKNLEKNGAPPEEAEKNPFYSVEKEISELKSLLPEIKAKIADMEDFKQETLKGMMATLNGQAHSSDGAGTSSSSSSTAGAAIANGSTPKPATDISHLIRKKRKPEDESSAAAACPVKKSCTDEADK